MILGILRCLRNTGAAARSAFPSKDARSKVKTQ